jgi:hypothetical protein
VAWFGDASGHDASFGHTLADVIAALQAKGIKVIAVPVSGSGDGLDSTGQATAIVNATGGVLLASAPPDQVANAILSGLQNLPVTVSPQLGACDPNLTVTFDAPDKTATSGEDVNFTETIAVASSAPFGTTLHCHVDFLLNGQLAGPEFGEDISITVPKHAATLTSTTRLQLFAQGHSAALSAVLTDPDGGTPISGKPVVLTLGSGSSAQSCTGTTNATGTASCSINPVTVPLGPQPVTDSFAGDAHYKAAPDYIQRALVYAFLKKGAFVLGDTTTAKAFTSSPDPTVTWWGAQWAKNNVLSGGAAPNAMKGFAGSPSSTPPACGGTYTTDTGNSTPPPAANAIPQYMGVIVSSHVTQSGSTISGDIRHIVVVNTDPGYQPNPGHPGTGTVVAAVC